MIILLQLFIKGFIIILPYICFLNIMQILIKSFNRPYYLDRCLASISKYVLGFEKIIIMDDGTPQIYLDKIKQKYPFVDIVYSENYLEKQSFILEKKGESNTTIPSKLWTNSVEKSSDYLVMLEDDMWFTSNIDLDNLQKYLATHDVQLFRLFWLGNSKLVDYESKKESQSKELCQPKKSIFNRTFFYWIYYRFQRLNKIKSFFGLYNKADLLAYYSVYGVAGMIFKRDYYLALWHQNQPIVNEMQQLLNAISYLKNKVKYPIAKPKNELLKTGFISAATHANKEHYSNQTNMFMLNEKLNQLWFNDKIDALENFPKDFSQNYIFDLLKSDSAPFAENWLNWHDEFKQQYIKLGCEI
jgi:glycosyltransferase involved in cell wall biosynthesis